MCLLIEIPASHFPTAKMKCKENDKCRLTLSKPETLSDLEGLIKHFSCALFWPFISHCPVK